MFISKKLFYTITFTTHEYRFNGKILTVQFKIKQKYRKGLWITTGAALFNVKLRSHHAIAQFWNITGCIS